MDKIVTIKSLGELLYATAAERHLDGKTAALEVGLTTATYSRITNGSGFALKWIIPIAKWCGINAQQLWELLETEAP